MAVEFQLNGKAVTLAESDLHQTLLSWLRAQGLTGTKEGCAEGECGACAVALLRNDISTPEAAARYVSVNSCLFPLGELAGTSVITVEHLAENGQLHPVQQAMVEHAGSQCGYCTPGFVMSLFCEYYRPERAGYDPEAISGNLCRCTGYRPIADAAKSLGQPDARDPFLIQLRAGKGAGPSAPDSDKFYQPTQLTRVFELLAQVPDAMLLGGGTDLMVPANQRGVRYPALIALDRVAELKQLHASATEVVIGAGVPLASLEHWLESHAADLTALRQLLPLFSSRLIRNRATLGGNLGTASPIGDSPPVLLALDATLSLASAAGVRQVKAEQFFDGYRKTKLAKGELIQSVHIPRLVAKLQRFYKVSKRMLDDISTVAAAFTLELDAAGCVKQLRLAYGGVAPTPVRASAAEQAALGKAWTESTLQTLIPLIQSAATPLSDHRGSADYRRAMLGKLLEQFFYESQAQQAAAE